MKILSWKNKDSWINDIDDYASDILNTELVSKIKSKNIKGCWSDDMAWLADQEIFYSFEEVFYDYYTHVKCFHGCRPINVSSYYERGFIGQIKDEIEKQFRTIFNDVHVEELNKAIEYLSDRGISEKGKIYFVCNDDELINESGHYLIQGSEYIMSMAACLSRCGNNQQDYRLRLREVGIPTIFEVNIPLDNIPSPQITTLIQTIIASWGDVNMFPEDVYDHDMGFTVHCDIEAGNIVGHSHPKRIHDPHFRNAWYHSKITTCEMCK